MPDWLTTIMAAVMAVIMALLLWRNIFGSDVDLRKEIDRNERTPAPDDQQLKWHIQHMRQDIMSITRILFWIFLLLLIILIKVFFKTIF